MEVKKMKNGKMKKCCILNLLFICLLAMMFGGANSVSAKKSNKYVHGKYSQTLKKLKKELKKQNYLKYQGPIYFKYCDFDKDGVDECIVRGYSADTNWNGGTDTALYTFKNGKVKCVLKVFNMGVEGEEYYYNYKKNIVIKYIGTYEQSTISICKLKKGKLKKVGGCKKSGGNYWINGKKVSENKYYQYYDSKVGSVSNIHYKFSEVTNKNLKKAI